jgi:hypothetical protein
MQTRIKVEIDSEGKSFYCPEYRLLWVFWVPFFEEHGLRARFAKLDSAKVFLRDTLRAREYKPNVRSYIHED